MNVPYFIQENSCTFSIVACFVLTFCYVSSLYIWRSNLGRDHPTTIKKRFFGVSCMMLMAPFFTHYFFTEDTLARGDISEQMGLRYSGLAYATVLPLLLTATLFLGPLTMQYFSGIWKLYSEPYYWVSSWQDLVWVRNHVVAPLSEEWVFRSCIMPLLLQCLLPYNAIFTGPVLFGVAHFHHMFDRVRTGVGFKNALLVSLFQFTYTTLFGAYSSFLFARTGHFMASLVAHIFCNHMGFPNVGEIPEHKPLHQVIIITNYLLGFVLWCFLLMPATDPGLYDNRLHWTT